MDLPLLYPLKDLSSVSVGLITIEVVELASKRANALDGSLPLKILNSFCPKVKEEQVKEIALIDAHRILIAAWRQTYDSSGYVAKLNCPSCNKLTLLTHDLTKSVSASPVYSQVHKLKAKDPDTLQPREFNIELAPLKFNVQCELLKMAINEQEDWAKILFDRRIKSVDGKPYTDPRLMSMPLFKAIGELIKDDVQAINSLLNEEGKCSHCEESVSSQLGIMDGNFLQSL